MLRYPQSVEKHGGNRWNSLPTNQHNDSGHELWSVYHPTVGNGQAPDAPTDTDRSTSEANTVPHTACRFTCRTCFGPLWCATVATTLGVAILII